MEPIITINEYPIGWEWLDKVPLEDFTWLIEIFATMTDNTDTYDFATFDKEATNGEPPYPVIEINRKGLANFLNDDQGHESGISMYGHYIACKSLDISSEEEYMNQLTDIELELILVLFLNSSGPNLDTFIPGNPWEHYCKYELHKHPFHTNEKEYNYFLDTFTSTDKYEQIMEIYANPR